MEVTMAAITGIMEITESRGRFRDEAEDANNCTYHQLCDPPDHLLYAWEQA